MKQLKALSEKRLIPDNVQTTGFTLMTRGKLGFFFSCLFFPILKQILSLFKNTKLRLEQYPLNI